MPFAGRVGRCTEELRGCPGADDAAAADEEAVAVASAAPPAPRYCGIGCRTSGSPLALARCSDGGTCDGLNSARRLDLSGGQSRCCTLVVVDIARTSTGRASVEGGATVRFAARLSASEQQQGRLPPGPRIAKSAARAPHSERYPRFDVGY